MNIDCEEVVKSVLPAFRRMIASHLIHDYNLSQTETAKLLETSQAVVSYYISSKRGKKIEYYSSLEDLKNMAIKSAGQLATGQTKMDQVSANFCELCVQLRAKKLLLKQAHLSMCQGPSLT
ncbi:MAG: transcriptional regulator [Nitrososphaerota archaeon]|nr:transcriptional regulator [Nitrososphaerota archaeon]